MRVCASPPLGPVGGVCTGHRLWPPGSRIIAGVCENCCRITCRRLVGRHPSNGGVPRMRANASLSGGAGTTVSCGATARGTWELKPEIQLYFARVDFLLKLHISFDDVFVDPDRGGEKTDGPEFIPPVYLLDPGKTLANSPTRVGFDLANDGRHCILGGNHDHQMNMIDLDAQRLDFNVR